MTAKTAPAFLKFQGAIDTYPDVIAFPSLSGEASFC